MYEYSAGYPAICQANHDVVARVDVVSRDGTMLASTLHGASPVRLAIGSGSVIADASQLIRRGADLTLVSRGSDLVPAAARDLFSVLSDNEIFVWAGVRSRLGISELFPQGVFVIADSEASATATGVTVSVRGQDRALRVQERVLTRPYTVAHNLDTIDAIKALILSRVPTMQFRVNITTPHRTVWHVYEERTNPLQAAAEMAELIGAVVYLDVEGYCVIDTIPDPAAAEPVWTYAGDGRSTIVSVTPKTSRADVKNGQIVIGESLYGITPARAEVWDTDPRSPTYVETWGRVPEFTNDPRVATTAQALDAATGLFKKRNGMSRQVDLSIVSNPAQQEDDVVRIEHDDTRLSDAFAIQRLMIPLRGTEAMPVSTRQRWVAA